MASGKPACGRAAGRRPSRGFDAADGTADPSSAARRCRVALYVGISPGERALGRPRGAAVTGAGLARSPH